MNFGNVVSFMNQQLKALKELEDLLAHAKQNPGHNVNDERMDEFERYIEVMKSAATTASELAKHYQSNTAPKTETPAEVKKEEGQKQVCETDSCETEKPKKRRSPKKQEPATEETVEPSAEELVEPITAEEPQEDEQEESFDFLD